jgi:hypothetical protein
MRLVGTVTVTENADGRRWPQMAADRGPFEGQDTSGDS